MSEENRQDWLEHRMWVVTTLNELKALAKATNEEVVAQRMELDAIKKTASLLGLLAGFVSSILATIGSVIFGRHGS